MTREELDALHAAATPGPMEYGIRLDGAAWYSIGVPLAGKHIAGDIYADEADLAFMTAMYNAWPTVSARLAELEERDNHLNKMSGLIRQLGGFPAWLAARDARMKKLGAAEWIQAEVETARQSSRVWVIYEDEWLKQEADRLRAEGGE